MKINFNLVFGAAIGASLTALAFQLAPTQSGTQLQQDSEKPLYWVAPMDPNYRRDEPGKSPMGMDLVPVYPDSGDPGAMPATIRIDPDVVNNLGVRTVKAQMSEWKSEIRTVGYVTFDEDRLVHIHPRVEGWVETLHIKAAGDRVAENQTLYELYAPELVNAQEELLLAMQRNNSRLLQAARDRLGALQMSDEFIQRLEQTGKVTQTVTFRAGRGGVVDNLAIREGFFVKPGNTMMSIGSLDEVWVEAEVFERQAAAVSEGLTVTMTTDFLPGKRWHGNVDYVYPTLDPVTRTVRLRLRFANQDELLKPNMFAQVVIHATTEAAVLTVPREAVIRTAKQDRLVLALGDGRFKSVAVELGRIGDYQAEILSGLVAGDEVVASAQFLLDSESSKTSDFKRMHHAPEAMDHSSMDHSAMDHSKMDHSTRDHSGSDQSDVQHEGMHHD
jgi:Cu(I)/Ag(I) efflux system membrane fusion protein